MAKQRNPPVQKAAPRPPVNTPRTAPQAAEKKASKPWPTNLKLGILLAAIAMIVYSNTYDAGYVLDDVMVIRDNQMVPGGIKEIPELLSTPHLRGYLNLSNDTYRPLSLVAFAIECEFFKFDANGRREFKPSVNHLLNILFFAGCIVVLFQFLTKLFDGKKPIVAFVATLLFAVHPIHTEIVANIKSRDELMCFFFGFMALSLFADHAKSGKMSKLIWGAIMLFLSYLSKETTITFIGVIPIIFFLYLNEDRKRSISITVATAVVTGIFLTIRFVVLNKYHANLPIPVNFVDNSMVRAPNAASRLATEILIMGYYLKLIFIPFPLSCDHSFNSIPYVTFGNIWVILTIVIYLGLAVLAVMRLIKNKRDPWAFAIIFFLFTISLFTNIFIVLAATLAERFLFFCSLGACLVIALAIDKWLVNKSEESIGDMMNTKVLAPVAIIAVVFAIITYNRNFDWKDNISLYKADVVKEDNNTRLHYYVASELQKLYGEETDPVKQKTLNDESIVHLKRSLAIFPDNTDSHAEIGAAYLRAKMYDSSILHLKRAIELNPKQSNASANLGTLYLGLLDYPNALTYYRRTFQVNPRNAVAWFNGAVCYYNLKVYDSAVIGFKKCMEVAPDFDNYKSYEFTAIVYKVLNQMDSAQKYANIAKNYNPKFAL